MSQRDSALAYYSVVLVPWIMYSVSKQKGEQFAAVLAIVLIMFNRSLAFAISRIQDRDNSSWCFVKS
jgi:hypothetical protein